MQSPIFPNENLPFMEVLPSNFELSNIHTEMSSLTGIACNIIIFLLNSDNNIPRMEINIQFCPENNFLVFPHHFMKN